MFTSRTSLTRLAVVSAAAFALMAPLAACSSDDDDTADAPVEAAEAVTDDTTAPSDADEMADDEMTDDESADDDAATDELSTTGLRDFLLEEDPAIGALFDWSTGDGIIAITYLGTQTVQMYAGGDLDVETATASCELASDHVFGFDESATIEVYGGGYTDGTKVVVREGADGTCAAV